MDLQNQAEQFRHAYGVVNDPAKADMQLGLIREESRNYEMLTMMIISQMKQLLRS